MAAHTKEYMAEYRRTHRERIRELQKKYNKEYYQKHKESEAARWKKYREEHREKIKLLNKIWHENHKDYSREYDRKWHGKHRIEHRKMMGYWAVHQRTQKLIKKLWIRPSNCPICWCEWKIEAHHPDYNNRNEVVFCCISCHQLIHHGVIPTPQPIVLQSN